MSRRVIAWTLGGSLAFLAPPLGAGLRAAPALSQTQRLTAVGLSPGDRFGSTVAVGGDVVAVGAYLARGGAGAVYLFHEVDGQWVPLQDVKIGKAGDQLGFDLALSADGGTLLASAPFAAVGGARCGAVYRAVRNGDGRFGDLVPLALPCEAGAELGTAVALAGDLTVVGARGAAARAGRVYVQEGSGGFREIGAAQTEAGAELGTAVSTDGDLVVAGAPFATVNGQEAAGKAIAFTRGSWTAVQLVAPSPSAREAFGYAVAIAAGSRIAVGAPLARGEAGAVHVYNSGGTLIGSVPGTSPSGQLGVALASADNTVYAGARWDGGGRGKGSGAVYPIAPALGSPLRASLPIAGAEFGFDVAAAGGVLVAGAFGEAGTGAAYVFTEAPPALTVGLQPVAAPVGESAGSVAVTVALQSGAARSAASHGPITVTLATMDGTAKAGLDYGAVTQTLDIPADADRASLSIPIYRDTLCEGEESFTVAITGASGASVRADAGQIQIRIRDETLPEITLSPSLLVTREGGLPVPLTVALSCPPIAPVTVKLNSTSLVGEVQPDVVVFAAGIANQTRTVEVRSLPNPSCAENPDYEVKAVATSLDVSYNDRRSSVVVENRNRDLRCVSGVLRVCSFADGTVYYAAILRNDGTAPQPDAPAAFEFFDTLPPEVSVVSASADRGVATVDFVENTVAWNGTIPPHAAPVVTVWIVGALAAVPPGDPVENRLAILTFDRDGAPPAADTFQIPPVTFSAFSALCDPDFPFP